MKDSNLQNAEVGFRRGTILGLTIAESFMLIAFALLLILALWRISADAEAARFEAFTRDQIAQLNSLEERGRLEILLELGESDADLAMLLDQTKRAYTAEDDRDTVQVPRNRLELIEERARLVSEEDVRRLAELAMELDPETRRELENLVRLEDLREELERLAALKNLSEGRKVAEIAEALEALDNDEQNPTSEVEALRSKIQTLLEKDVSGQEQLVRSLRETIGSQVAKMGGTIDVDGAIILPDELLFEQGKAEILPQLEAFLIEFCSPWLFALKGSGLDVGEMRIEGHASSEWKGVDPKEAFVRNLDLSQRRAQAVLGRCLDLAGDTEGGEWARKHLTAVGYSSSRVVTVDGVENAELSRRVVFSTSLKRDQLLREIGGAVRNPTITNAAISELVGTASVIDGDTIEVRGQRIRLHGIDAPESSQPCQRADGSNWRCGQQAALALSDKIGRRTVTCEVLDIDRYGRSIGVCSIAGEDLGAWMVSQGWAMAYVRFSRDYVPLEDNAKGASRGIWASQFEAPWEWRRNN